MTAPTATATRPVEPVRANTPGNTRPRFSTPTTPTQPCSRAARRARHRCSHAPASTTQGRAGVGCRVFLNNRYYDPTLARFISVDPLVAMTGEAYSYGGNNPVANSDPSGLCWGWNLVCKAATVAVYTYDHTTRIVTDPAQLVSAVSSPLNTALETFSAFEGIVVDGADLKRSGEYCGRIAECLLGADALGDADATTIGHTIRFRAHDPAPGLEAHETQHVYDSELLGDMFYPLYLGEEALRVATPIDGGYNDLWSEKRAYWVSYNYDDGYRPGYQGPRCNGIGACAVPGFVPHTTWPEGDPHDHWGPTSVADAAGFAAGFA